MLESEMHVKHLLMLREKYPNKEDLSIYMNTYGNPHLHDFMSALDYFNVVGDNNELYDISSTEVDFILNSPILTLYERNPELFIKLYGEMND